MGDSSQAHAAVPSDEELRRAQTPGSLAIERDTVSTKLLERLDAEDTAEIERRICADGELSAHWANATTEALRRFLLLCAALWLDIPGVSEKTGLSSVQPPEDVHAMARGTLAAAGGLYEADLVADALASAGADVAAARSALDFGCSSGRVVRVLAAAYPEIAWHACDPNEQAVSWAREHLAGIDFFVSGNHPPLALADGSLDLVYAISVWSHFHPTLGLRWFSEMHRLVRPGGHLVCTTHGSTSVGFYAANGLRPLEQSREIAWELYRRSWWYAAEFGERGDWGVVNPDWGTAFLSPEWLLAELCPHWRVVEFASGRNQNNQDVYVLQRV